MFIYSSPSLYASYHKTPTRQSYDPWKMTTPSTTTALRGDQQPSNDDDIHEHEDDPEFYPLIGIDRTRYHVIKTPPYQTFDKGLFISLNTNQNQNLHNYLLINMIILAYPIIKPLLRQK